MGLGHRHVRMGNTTLNGAHGMAAEPKKRKPQTPEGQALVHAMVTNKKLVAETNEAFDRARAGEQGIRWEDVKRELDAR